MEKIGKDMTLCEECNRIVKYRIEWCDETEELGGHMVTYRGLRAFCLECGKEVVASSVDDYNLDALYAQYRKDFNRITPEEVCSIVEKYAISPEDLSALLGWESKLVARYMKKYIVPEDYSDRLRSIMDDEAVYRILLEDNKDRISPEAYERSKTTLRDDMSPEEFVERYGIGEKKD